MNDDTGWGEGYSTDHAYTTGFYPEQAPEHINLACLFNGVEPVPLDRPFTYCELGCGQGATVTLLAAANPTGRFYAADFMPAHVAGAARRADAAGLDNLTLLENSFAELAEGRVDLPPFDFITMHGVYSWVSRENRRLIVDFAARYLKPGGLVYVSYNALPGWAQALPMRRLMRTQASMVPGGGAAGIGHAQALLEELVGSEGGYFAQQPDMAESFEVLKKEDEAVAYLVHEYLNQVAEPMYHADVAADFARAKLAYAGSGLLSVAFQPLPAEQQALLDEVPDPAWRETVRDFLINTRFRMDVFVRGRRGLPAPVKLERLKRCRLALTVAREDASLCIDLPKSPQDDPQDAVLDALVPSPRRLDELAQLPLFGGDVELVAQVSTLMAGGPRVGAVALDDRDGVDPGPARRLNRVVALGARDGEAFPGLASPVTGNGIKVSHLECLVYAELAERPGEMDAAAIAPRVRPFLRVRPEVQGGAQGDGLVAQVDRILCRSVPLWRALKVL